MTVFPKEKHAAPELTDAHDQDLPQSTLALMAEAAEHQTRVTLELQALLSSRGGTFEEHFLTAEKPEWTVKEIDECRGFAVINFSPITVQLGFGGRNPIAGGGIPIPAQTYLQIPTETNLAIIAATVAELEGLQQAMVAFIRYRHRVNLIGGALSAAATGGSSARETASAVTGTSPRTVAVGAASAAVIAANATRKGLEIQNTGAEAVSLGIGNAAVIGDDIVLEPKASWNGTISGTLWRGAVNAIAAKASSLGVVEV